MCVSISSVYLLMQKCIHDSHFRASEVIVAPSHTVCWNNWKLIHVHNQFAQKMLQ